MIDAFLIVNGLASTLVKPVWDRVQPLMIVSREKIDSMLDIVVDYLKPWLNTEAQKDHNNTIAQRVRLILWASFSAVQQLVLSGQMISFVQPVWDRVQPLVNNPREKIDSMFDMVDNYLKPWLNTETQKDHNNTIAQRVRLILWASFSAIQQLVLSGKMLSFVQPPVADTVQPPVNNSQEQQEGTDSIHDICPNDTIVDKSPYSTPSKCSDSESMRT